MYLRERLYVKIVKRKKGDKTVDKTKKEKVKEFLKDNKKILLLTAIFLIVVIYLQPIKTNQYGDFMANFYDILFVLAIAIISIVLGEEIGTY